MNWEEQYQELLHDALYCGVERSDRTGTGTRALFGQTLKADLREGFPLLTLRKLSFNNVEAEALWYLRGEGHLDFLHERGARFWDPWAREDGRSVGPVYGVQWRSWQVPTAEGMYREETVDQVADAVGQLKANPSSRRMLVSAWNVADLHAMALPPCPFAWQLHGHGNAVSMTVYQRSADMVVGLPHDVAVHALLLTMIAEVAGRTPAELTFMLGDAHVYMNHLDAARTMIGRASKFAPKLFRASTNVSCPGVGDYEQERESRASVDDFRPGDFTLGGYNPWPGFRVEVAV